MPSLLPQSKVWIAAWDELWRSFPEERAALTLLETRLNYRFAHPALLFEAMTHRSAIFLAKTAKKPSKVGHELSWNERLEFLGDAVLNLAVSTSLWLRPERLPEGELSRIRAQLVNEQRLAAIARSLGLGSALVVGKSVKNSSTELPEALLADALEALFGAIYLDGGYTAVQDVISQLFAPYVGLNLAQLDQDFKTALQEWAQEHLGEKPEYLVSEEHGPAHAKEFCVTVLLQSKALAKGRGASKKQAAQAAAARALQKLARKTSKKKRSTL